jgi:hypothetical protein
MGWLLCQPLYEQNKTAANGDDLFSTTHPKTFSEIYFRLEFLTDISGTFGTNGRPENSYRNY